MKLIRPTTKYQNDYLKALSEIESLEPKNLSMLAKHARPEEIREDFGGYVSKLKSFAEGKNLPSGFVACTILWLIDDDDKFVGQASIRHQLTEFLLRQGGHIGYIITPSSRRRGLGTEILRLSIKAAQKLGIKKILVTCNPENTGSKKIILKNGGKLDDSIDFRDGEQVKLRFWIE